MKYKKNVIFLDTTYPSRYYCNILNDNYCPINLDLQQSAASCVVGNADSDFGLTADSKHRF